jgi:hypothetical protein
MWGFAQRDRQTEWAIDAENLSKTRFVLFLLTRLKRGDLRVTTFLEIIERISQKFHNFFKIHMNLGCSPSVVFSDAVRPSCKSMGSTKYFSIRGVSCYCFISDAEKILHRNTDFPERPVWSRWSILEIRRREFSGRERNNSEKERQQFQDLLSKHLWERDKNIESMC